MTVLYLHLLLITSSSQVMQQHNDHLSIVKTFYYICI
jgi:hypothetical protein